MLEVFVSSDRPTIDAGCIYSTHSCQELLSYSRWGNEVKLIFKMSAQKLDAKASQTFERTFTFYFIAPRRVTKKSPNGVRAINTACADCSDIQKTANNRQQQGRFLLEIQYFGR